MKFEIKERKVYELWYGDTFIGSDIDKRVVLGRKKVLEQIPTMPRNQQNDR